MCPLWDNLSDAKVACDRKRTVRNVPQVSFLSGPDHQAGRTRERAALPNGLKPM